MNRERFEEWMKRTGYSGINDWNMQQINDFSYYFIKNYQTGKYALIRRFDNFQNTYSFEDCEYEVMIEGWTDYNGWE